jgi:hypothetical protein
VTIQLIAPVVGLETDLVRLAELYANQEIDAFSAHLTLLRLTPAQDEHQRWAKFEDLVHAVQVTDPADECPALVDDAVHALLRRS